MAHLYNYQSVISRVNHSICQKALPVLYSCQLLGQSTLMSTNSSSWTVTCECIANDKRILPLYSDRLIN
ncbi:hypothetical protein BpHYR1_033131 [Brachionus plicatilis]|uniref:Uncharacterized protein n=1 Tax=Brachionus plicatilis TaxID=10195 RepID=A0A3M7SUQ0_BRAPC|nr:hypothetical protein BpHYR1_033131 [Brachionus plicatilis]